MECYYYRRSGSDKLLLCFLGWASDERTLGAFDLDGFDILAVYDYRRPEFPRGFPELLAGYGEVYLLAWSFGVFQAERAAGFLPELRMALAVNGTPLPAHERYGIPPRGLEITVRGMAAAGPDKFYERMGGSGTEGFVPCGRSAAELADELARLADGFVRQGGFRIRWSEALAGEDDVIFPFENLCAFWREKMPQARLTGMKTAHYPFGETGIAAIKEIIRCKTRI